MGASEIYPQALAHSSNGRYIVACGDGEWIVYTATALRNKAFGAGLEFVWAKDPNIYAVRESSSSIKIYKNFKVRLLNCFADCCKTSLFRSYTQSGRISSPTASTAVFCWRCARMVRSAFTTGRRRKWCDASR